MMHNHPGTTLADADSIFWDEFLIPQYFQHKNDDGTIENAGIWYFFNTEKFFDVEILHKADILQALSSAAPISSATAETHSVALPTYPGLIYEGPGIYFTANGQEHEMTGSNRTVLELAIKSGADLTWRYIPTRARKYGIPPSLTVHVLDTKAQIVPDVTFSVELK